MPLPSKDTDPLGYYAYKLGEAEQEIKQLREANGKLRAAFRANMLRYGPRKNLDAEIDRVLFDCLVPEYTDAQFAAAKREAAEGDLLAAGTHYLDANGRLQSKTVR